MRAAELAMRCWVNSYNHFCASKSAESFPEDAKLHMACGDKSSGVSYRAVAPGELSKWRLLIIIPCQYAPGRVRYAPGRVRRVV